MRLAASMIEIWYRCRPTCEMHSTPMWMRLFY